MIKCNKEQNKMKQATSETIKKYIGNLDIDYFKLVDMDYPYIKSIAPVIMEEFSISFTETVAHLCNYPLEFPVIKESYVKSFLEELKPKKKEIIKAEKPKEKAKSVTKFVPVMTNNKKIQSVWDDMERILASTDFEDLYFKTFGKVYKHEFN